MEIYYDVIGTYYCCILTCLPFVLEKCIVLYIAAACCYIYPMKTMLEVSNSRHNQYRKCHCAFAHEIGAMIT
jgi:hypothetical protein